MSQLKDQLADSGFAILPDFLTTERVQALRTRTEALFEEEGENAGSEFRQEPNTRRLANLIAKDPLYQDLVVEPSILALITTVLGDRFKLSSMNARSANPHSNSLQPLHADMGLIADTLGYSVCNTLWMLDDFTEENGALRLVPGSHRWGRLPQQSMPDPNAQHPMETLVTGTAGTVVIMNAHAWHGGTANRTALPRRALHGFYCRSDKAQQQYQKQLIPKATQADFSPALRAILALDDPLNDVLSAGVDRPSGFLR